MDGTPPEVVAFEDLPIAARSDVERGLDRLAPTHRRRRLHTHQ
jgi:hypothetical protein